MIIHANIPSLTDHIQMTLTLQGRDSWDRPVYKGPDGNLYVDVDPRKGWGPNICTKYQNEFDGEPDTPVEGVEFHLTPYGISGK